MQKVWKTRFIAPLVAVLAIGAAIGGGFALAQTSGGSEDGAAAPAEAGSSSTAAITHDAAKAPDSEELEELAELFRSQGFAGSADGSDKFVFTDFDLVFAEPHLAERAFVDPSFAFGGPGFGGFGPGGFGFGHGQEDEEGLSALGKYLVPESGDEIADALEPGLGRAVADSAITQAEADELLAWIRSAPAALFELPERLEAMFGEEYDPDNALEGALNSEFENLEFGNIGVDAVAAILGVEVEALRQAFASAFFQGFRQRFDEQAEKPNFLGGVAEELGVTEQALMDAYRQVAEQQRDAAIDAGLRAFVTAGVLTQAESNSIDGWIDDLPSLIEDEMNRGLGGFGLGGLALGGFGGGFGPGAFGGFDDFGHGEFDFEDFDGFFDHPEEDEDGEDHGDGDGDEDGEESGV